ncbi:MAG: hypothetical protein JST70_01810 [Bacteroidetes bacterium]|nr:hypothetical protein [Bacteroidota bacterium]
MILLNRTLSLVLLCLMSYSGQAQDFKKRCGGDTLLFTNGNKSHFSMVVHTPYRSLKSKSEIPKFIRDKNADYISDRIPDDVRKKVKFDDSYIVDFKDTSLVFNKEWLSIADRRVKYAFQYYIKIDARMKYYFTNVFDSLGNLISKTILPDKKINPGAYKLLSLCDAKTFAESDKFFDTKAWYAHLEYSDSAKIFVWEIQQIPFNPDGSDRTINKTIFLNANNGSVISRSQDTTYSEHKAPPFPKLK